MRLLLTNDDGFDAPGIRFLHDALRPFHDIVVAAPAVEQSGVGHAFTYRKGIRLEEKEFVSGTSGYAVFGTPADCVKVALGHLLSEKPDAVISGINNGDNTGIAGFYSGTVGAAREAAFWGVLGIAFSVANNEAQFFGEFEDLIPDIVSQLSKIFCEDRESEKQIYYNVNFPGCLRSECHGIKICRQSLAFYRDSYRVKESAEGVDEYWLRGVKEGVELSNEFDARAVENQWITITPHHFDTTDFAVMSCLKDIATNWKE